MAELILMQRENAEMFVKPVQLAEYLAAGWKEIKRVPMSGGEEEPAPKRKSIEPELKTAKNKK